MIIHGEYGCYPVTNMMVPTCRMHVRPPEFVVGVTNNTKCVVAGRGPGVALATCWQQAKSAPLHCYFRQLPQLPQVHPRACMALWHRF